MDLLTALGYVPNYITYYSYSGTCKDLLFSLSKKTRTLGKSFPLVFKDCIRRWDSKTLSKKHYLTEGHILTHTGENGYCTSFVEGEAGIGDSITFKILQNPN